jgi:hypothetical protein
LLLAFTFALLGSNSILANFRWAKMSLMAYLTAFDEVSYESSLVSILLSL